MLKIIILSMLFVFSASPSLALKEVRTIPTRDGVTMDFLLRSKGSVIDKTAVILFSGGDGGRPFRLEADGRVKGGNFLVRSSKDFAQEFLAVIVASPSDQASGMDDDFRKSAEHATDITKLMEYLSGQGVERFYLIGTSRGVLSVAALATKIQNTKLKGIVLTSSLEYTKFMRWIPLNTIKLPVLMVHHVDDACKICSLDEAMRTRDVLLKTTTVEFIEISGGDMPKSGPCDPLSPHGFFGVEEKTVKPIVEWIRKH